VTYIDQLKASELKASEQSAKGERARKLTEGWELALNIAGDCRKKFMENVTTIKDMEVKSTEALELLTKR
jgi:flagellar biosynthesis/type III secretory pathway chaperone